MAINALGFCAIKVEQCHIEGFEFPVQFSDGAQGMISDCVVWNPTVLALLEAVTELRGDPELNATNEGVTILWLK